VMAANNYVTCWLCFLVLSLVAWGFFCGTYAAHKNLLSDVTQREDQKHPALVAELVLYGIAGSVAFIVSCCCFHVCMREDKSVFGMFMADLCGGVKAAPKSSARRSAGSGGATELPEAPEAPEAPAGGPEAGGHLYW